MSSILRGSRKFILGLGLAGCGAAAGVILGMKEVDENTMKRMRRGFVAAAAEFLPSSANFAFSKDWKESEPSKAPFPLSYKGNVLPLHHGIKWDENWDYRQPEFLLKPLKGKFGSPSTDSDNDFNEKLEKAKATASRHLILVRHGQYNLDGKTDQDRYLTDLGREQARLTGLRLKELNLPYTKMVKSTMTRATETANIIGKELPQDLETSSCDFLREGAPIQPEPPVGHWRPEAKKFYEDGARIEAAFRRYFHRADPEQKKDSYEIMVCHANVIRYFICRALQFPPEAWLRFSLHNCSLTWIAIRPSGRVTVYTVGDIGHVPPTKMTTS